MSDPSNSAARGTSFFDVRMRGFRDRAEVAETVAILAKRVIPLPTESVALADAARRVLAEDIIARTDVPAFARSAMDGYALRAQETFGATPYNPLELAIVGVALPGRPFGGSLCPGQAVRIMTGAPLPEGADAILQAEAADEAEGRVRITDAVPPQRHVGRRGEDIQAGSVILHAGRVLRPQDLGVLASLGMSHAPVVRRPTVALVVTGDELLPCGTRPEGFKIVDSNSVMLRALVGRDGGIAQSLTLVPDNRADVTAALLTGREDVFLVTGGSSVGQEDHAPRALAEHGELTFHGVALRPASPAGGGFLQGRPVLLLPGNPVSCLCAYDFFAGPVIRKLGGRPTEWPYRTRRLPLARKLSSAVGRVDYVRVVIENERVEPLATSGAAILTSTTRADGFVLVSPDSEGFAAGEEVEVYLYDP